MTAKQRLAYAADCLTVSERYIHDWHAEIAENRLAHDGIKPELLAYIRGIGESVR